MEEGMSLQEVAMSITLRGNITRACPGQYLALDSVWIAVASILAVFDLTKAVEDDGKVIEPRCEYFSGLARYVDISHMPEQKLIPEQHSPSV
jgi:hypothetical protein